MFEVANLLSQELGRDVDLVDIRSSSTVMRKEIFRTGILLLDPMPMRRMEFEMHTLSDYARLNEERKSILIHTGSFAA